MLTCWDCSTDGMGNSEADIRAGLLGAESVVSEVSLGSGQSLSMIVRVLQVDQVVGSSWQEVDCRKSVVFSRCAPHAQLVAILQSPSRLYLTASWFIIQSRDEIQPMVAVILRLSGALHLRILSSSVGLTVLSTE